MRRFNSLIEEKKEFSWARAWLNDVGIDETNPATLMIFVLGWMDLYIVVKQAIRTFQPA